EGPVAVDEVLAAAAAGVGDVGSVGKGDVTIRRGDGAAGQGGVAVVVVPGAETAARGVEAVRVGPGRRDDDVLRVAVRGRGGVAEVARRLDRLAAQRVAVGLLR